MQSHIECLIMPPAHACLILKASFMNEIKFSKAISDYSEVMIVLCFIM